MNPHIDAALAHISNALDDLQYSPDQRPVPLLNAAMDHLRRLNEEHESATASEAGSDDAAVDRFAAEMKAKLAEARAKGRGGWQDREDCPQQHLSDLLRGHVEKGDPGDVANFCMFLWARGESILPSQEATHQGEGEYVDLEAVAWAYRKLLDFGYYTSEQGAMMGDRLNLMLLAAKPTTNTGSQP